MTVAENVAIALASHTRIPCRAELRLRHGERTAATSGRDRTARP
jgi:hypothetical protein